MDEEEASRIQQSVYEALLSRRSEELETQVHNARASLQRAKKEMETALYLPDAAVVNHGIRAGDFQNARYQVNLAIDELCDPGTDCAGFSLLRWSDLGLKTEVFLRLEWMTTAAGYDEKAQANVSWSFGHSVEAFFGPTYRRYRQREGNPHPIRENARVRQPRTPGDYKFEVLGITEVIDLLSRRAESFN